MIFVFSFFFGRFHPDGPVHGKSHTIFVLGSVTNIAISKLLHLVIVHFSALSYIYRGIQCWLWSGSQKGCPTLDLFHPYVTKGDLQGICR